MKSFKLAFVMAVGGLTLGVLTSACGSDETDDGNQGGSGGAGAAGSSSSTGPGPTSASSSTGGPSSSSTGGGGAPPGAGVCGTDLSFQEAVVDGCLSANCCTTFDPCVDDAACTACLEDPMGAGCAENALYTAFTTCRDDNCPLTICDSDLSNSSQTSGPLLNFHACLNDACCASFTPCADDTDCNACLLDPTLEVCATNPLFTAFTDCRDLNCPFDICESQIGFVTNYEDFEVSDPNPALNKCLADACCTEMTACADPDGDNYVENDPDSQICLGCLQDPAGCDDPAIKTAAEAFLDCVDAAPCD
jgi:hypothetical protein